MFNSLRNKEKNPDFNFHYWSNILINYWILYSYGFCYSPPYKRGTCFFYWMWFSLLWGGCTNNIIHKKGDLYVFPLSFSYERIECIYYQFTKSTLSCTLALIDPGNKAICFSVIRYTSHYCAWAENLISIPCQTMLEAYAFAQWNRVPVEWRLNSLLL